MKLPSTLVRLLGQLKTEERFSVQVIPDFGIFIDTHRDQPHVGTFFGDIHRGMCRPINVDLQVVDATADPAELWIVDPTTGHGLRLDDKHMFVTPDFWGDFVSGWLVEHGVLPVDEEGVMVTSHLRDPRQKVYKLKSFRQMLEWRHDHEFHTVAA